MDSRLKAAIDYLRAEMAKGFYAPDKEYIETLIFYAEYGLRQKLSNAEILMFVRGWQGGTIHQIADELETTVYDIADADYDRMQDLMRLAQKKSSWKDIETHPRDNSWYLVTDGLNVYQVSFDVATADWWTRENGSLCVNNGIEPIYWMPIPFMPEEMEE